VQYVRLDHDSQRQLLQMRKLRDDIRLRLMPEESGIGNQESGRRREDIDHLERVTHAR
jgi:hypothetical protein